MRILPAIQHTINNHLVFRFHPVIDRVRKPFGQQPVETKNFPMNPSVKYQGIDVRKKRVQKITAQAAALPFVKIPPVREVIESR
jgi:hypothetical protein